MVMAPPRLLRSLIAPLSPVDWLPCHRQLLASAALLHRWLPSVARLRCPSCSDGFKLLLVSAAVAEVRFVASASMAPPSAPATAPSHKKSPTCSGGRLSATQSSSECPRRCRTAA